MTQLEQTGSTQHELEHSVQSTQTLVKASAFAGLFGALILTVAILPAEYNIDPTGIGAYLGLTKLANTAPLEPTKQTRKGQAGEFQKHNTEITIPAGKGLEYKLSMLKGEAIRYAWNSTGGELFFDFHGEPKGDTTGYFESYTISTSDTIKGSLTAPFDGSHGWYWENKASSPITVSLKIEGNYEIIGIK
ncbi:hypothetical protein [Neptunomonas qingdaonensis]|uniref:Transmembrane anchor protein n=1 Tax=Neptunomonas qingdaonensis TaxID=1045558 RepID=A0A1I2SKW4_9GAMM|nr:hypothetical protein [Neptunomonas qingdaonensis]SFG53163.1 hypothetical protein SAMN05216175_10852 [Neptunomonas qingdaonensis]